MNTARTPGIQASEALLRGFEDSIMQRGASFEYLLSVSVQKREIVGIGRAALGQIGDYLGNGLPAPERFGALNGRLTLVRGWQWLISEISTKDKILVPLPSRERDIKEWARWARDNAVAA